MGGRVMSGSMRIGQVARMTGLSIKAIRYYEAVGVLPPPMRSGRRYRLYGEEDMRRLFLIKQAKRLGVSLREVGELLNLANVGCCTTVRPGLHAVLEEKLRQINSRIRDLQTLRASIADYAERLPIGTEEDAASCTPDRCVPAVEVAITLLVEEVSKNGRFPAAKGRAKPKG